MDDTKAARSGRQKEIDFVRGEQLGLVRGCSFPPIWVTEGKARKKVTNPQMKSVLLVIDSHAGKTGACYVSLDTLARETGLGRRTVIRVLQALEMLSVITHTPHRHGRSTLIHRRIVFANLHEFHSARNDDSQCPVDDSQCPVEPFTVPAAGTQREGRELQKELHKGKSGVSEKSGGAGKGTLEPLQSGLKTSDLADALRVDQLWKIAARRGLLPQTSYWRLTFFGLCWSLYRRRHKLLNPVGLLHRKLADGRQAVLDQVDDSTDRAWARKTIAELDGIEPATPARASADPRAIEIQEFEQRRREQQRRLQEEFPAEVQR